MATIADNTVYLELNNRVFANPGDEGVYVSCAIKLSAEEQATSAGSGSNWKKRARGLNETSIEIAIVCDDSRWVEDMKAITNNTGLASVIPIEAGINGRDSGQPRHKQEYLITQIDLPDASKDKAPYMMNISGNSSGEPQYNMYAGDTYGGS